MASGRLASGSIAAGGATQLYRNTTGKAQVITLLASSQVSGKAPKLNVKITNENFSETATETTVTSGTNHTLTTAYPTLTDQLVGSSSYSTASTAGSPAYTDSGSYLHLSIGDKETHALSMGQAWSKGYSANSSGNLRDHIWSKASFGGQPMGIGGSGGGSYRYNDANNSLARSHMPVYPPYYFENPNAFNQRKARGVIGGNDAGDMYHIEDISKMPTETLMKYYNYYTSAGSNMYSASDPNSDTDTYGTRTTTSNWGHGGHRGYIYDVYTGLCFKISSSGYTTYKYFDETTPTNNTSPYRNYGDASSNCGIFRWSHNAFNGSDPQSYDTQGHAGVYGCFFDCENGLVCAAAGSYNTYVGFKYYDKMFNNMMDKDTRSINQDMEAFSRSSYYHTISYAGSSNYLKLQWVAYHPGNNKYYVCFWDNSGTYSASPVPTMGTSYPDESGIFEVDISKIAGKDQTIGNTAHKSFTTAVTDGDLTKVASVPDTVSGLMSKPMRIADSLWTAHCQNGKQYFSTDLYTWGEKSATYIPDAYQMVNASKLGTAGTDEANYYIAAASTSVVYFSSVTSIADVYDQAAIAGIIAKGAVTPYEQKSIILSNLDSIYIENEDATNGISVTAMGVDI